MISGIQFNKERDSIDIMLTVAVFFPVFSLMMQITLLYLGVPYSNAHLIALILSIVPLITTFKNWVEVHLINVIFAYTIIFTVCLIHYLLFYENRVEYWHRLIELFFMCIPCMLNNSFIKDDKQQIKVLRVLGIGIFLLGEFVLVLKLIGRGLDITYSMSYSYYMLLPAVVFLYLGTVGKQYMYVVLSVISCISMVILGSRGAVAAYLVYCVFSLWFSDFSRIIKMTGTTLIGVFYLIRESLISIAFQILSGFGIESRTLSIIRMGGFITYDSGRSQIQQEAYKAISNHPFMGNGLMSEYRIMGTYSHNIFVDILLHSGFIFGGLLIVLILAVTIRAYLAEKDKSIFWMYFCYGFLPMMVSGSYISSLSFWIYIGYCFRKQNLRIKHYSMGSYYKKRQIATS